MSLFLCPAHLAHFAIAEPHARQLHFFERLSMDYADNEGRAGALTNAYHVWNGNWSVREIDGVHKIHGSSRTFAAAAAGRSKAAAMSR